MIKYNVTLKKIQKVVKENFDKTVDFIMITPNEQYREAIHIKI